MHEPVQGDSGIHRALEVWGRRRGLGVLAFFAALIPALGFGLSLPDIYRAGATVLVERQQVAETFVRPSVTEDLETRLHTMSEEVLSRAHLIDLIGQFDLYPDLRREASNEAAIQRMRRDIDLELKGADGSRGRGATVAFVLGYRGRDPHTVARVANAIAAFYVEENLAAREAQASRTAGFLKARLEEMKQKLADQESRIGEYKRRHTGELPQQVDTNLASLERLNAQLQLNSEKQIRAMERRDRLAKQVAEAGGTGSAAEPEAAAARLSRLRRELQELRLGYSDKYPDVVRLEREIAELAARPAAAGKTAAAGGDEDAAAGPPAPGAAEPTPLGRSLREAETEIAALRQEEDRLRRTVLAYEQRIENIPQRQQEFQTLTRDYETTRELYDSLLKGYEESLLAESMEHGRATERFRVLDPAVPPREPAAPNRIWLSIVSLMLAVGAGVGAIALAEHLDTSFHNIDSLRAFSRLPVLATIPRIVTRGDGARRILRAGGTVIAVGIGVAAATAASHYVAREFEPLVFILSGGRI